MNKTLNDGVEKRKQAHNTTQQLIIVILCMHKKRRHTPGLNNVSSTGSGEACPLGQTGSAVAGIVVPSPGYRLRSEELPRTSLLHLLVVDPHPLSSGRFRSSVGLPM